MLRTLSNPLFVRYALPILLTGVFFLFPFRSSPIAGEALGVPFLVAYTVLLPGAALTRLLRLRPVNAADAAALWTVNGLAVLLACTFAWALLGIPTAGFAAIIALVTTSLHVAAPPLDNTRIHASARRENRAERGLFIAMMGLVIVFGCAVYIAGAPLDFGKDTYDYIAYANEVAATGDAFPTTAFYRDPGLDGADLRKGLLHAVFGFYHGWLGLDTIRIFAMLAALMLIAAALVVYSAALRMFDDRAVAALSAIFFLLCYDGGPADALQRTWFYPSRFGMVALLAYTATALEFMRRPGTRGLMLMALYAFAAAAIHIQFTVLVGFVAGVILLWKACSPREQWNEHIRGALQVGAAGFFGFLPYAAFRYVTAYQTNELHTQVQAAVYIFGNAFIVNPVHAWQSAGFLGVAAIVGIVSAWSLRRRHPAAGFLCAAVLSVLFVQYNPFVLPTVYKVITYLVYRLDKAVPWFMLPAFITVVVFRRVDAPTRRGFTRATLLLTLAAVIAGLLSFPGLGAIRPASLAWERENSYRRWEDGLRDLSERLPAGSVIASDPVTSYIVSALTPHYVLCTLDQHAPPNDRLSQQRMSAARDIVGPLTPHDVRIALVDALDVTHILVNGNLPGDMLLDYWAMAPSVAMQSRTQFDSRPDLYERTELRDSLTVYTTTGRGARKGPGGAAALVVADLPPRVVRVGRRAGEAWLVGARMGADSVSRGGRLDVDLYWSRREPLPMATYIVSIRLDQVDLSLPIGGRPFPKLARKFKEKIDGQRYRSRFDHMPSHGFFSPEMWPVNATVSDLSAVRVPADLAPGLYAVRAKLLSVAHAPNHRLRDFFYDDDLYHGVEIGRITVTP